MRKANTSGPDIGRRLSDGFKRWTKVAERSLSRPGLSLAEVRALMMLSELGPSSMITLSAEQGMTAPGMTLVVDKLERSRTGSSCEKRRRQKDNQCCNNRQGRRDGQACSESPGQVHPENPSGRYASRAQFLSKHS